MRLRCLTLRTTRLPALADFYGHRLGLPVVLHTAERLTLQVAHTTLTFETAPPVVGAAAPRYHFAFNVPAEAIQPAARWLGAAAPLLPVAGQPVVAFPNWRAESVYAFDPAGNIIECIARHERPLPAAGVPFSAADLHGISEIGVVVTDVPAAAQALGARYGLPVFARQPPLPTFAALGDDAGLLILVPPGRNWFPTTVPSAAFPLEIELETDGSTHRLAFPDALP